MQITLKLYAMLSEYLPAGSEKNICQLTLADDMCIDAVISEFKLPRKLVHLVLLNGTFVPPSQRTSASLSDGDTVAIWPPVAGA